jgi:adenine-specific DNA-methyltransferase
MTRSPTSDNAPPPSGAVLSDGVVAALVGFSDDALTQSHDESAARAFQLWLETFGDSDNEGAEDDAFAAFAGEAAFAAAARTVLDAHIGPQLRRAFPHIYGSPLFAWYEPPEDIRDTVSAALARGAPDEPLELLGWLYQFSIPLEVRRRFGQFYTPRPIVQLMLDNVGFAGTDVLGARLVDPACGAGAYLIEGTRRVLAACDDAGLDAAETCRAVQRVIHGLDLNPLGVLLTEAAIALMLVPALDRLDDDAELEPLHLYVTDTLRAGEFGAESHADAAEDIKNRAGDFADGFTHVVANPPYAKFPTRLMTDEQKRRFAATTYGHPNLYGLFLQVGVELLADDGRLSFINPKSFVSGLYFRNLRRFLQDHLAIERFDLFDKRTGLFEGVLQEVVILSGHRGIQREQIELREFAGSPNKPAAKVIQVESESVLLGEEFDHAFFTSPDSLAHHVLARMTERSEPLSAYGFKAVTGTIVWNRLKPHVRNEASADALPLVWGNGIRLFRFAGTGNRAGEATHMALVPKTENIITFGDALLVKRMTAREEARRLVACRVPDELANDPRGYFAENHINIVRPTDDARLDLDVVLGLLNSRLFDYVFRALNGNTNVSATELEMLPVVEGPELADIAACVRELTGSRGADAAALAELDQLVYRLYGLDEATIDELEGTDALALAS